MINCKTNKLKRPSFLLVILVQYLFPTKKNHAAHFIRDCFKKSHKKNHIKTKGATTTQKFKQRNTKIKKTTKQKLKKIQRLFILVLSK